jgi:hypothetical protein
LYLNDLVSALLSSSALAVGTDFPLVSLISLPSPEVSEWLITSTAKTALPPDELLGSSFGRLDLKEGPLEDLK